MQGPARRARPRASRSQCTPPRRARKGRRDSALRSRAARGSQGDLRKWRIAPPRPRVLTLIQSSRRAPAPAAGLGRVPTPRRGRWSQPRRAPRVSHDTALEPIREKVLAGRRLSFEDGLALYRTHDLLGLGQLANHVREETHGDAAYFVWNTHVNHTNVCVATCDFCAFAARKDEPRAYTMAIDDVVKNVASLPTLGARGARRGRPPPGPALLLLHRHAEGDQGRSGPTST